MLDLRTDQRTNILQLPITGSWEDEPGIHISGNNYDKPGWVAISTDGGASDTWAYHQIFL